MLAFAADPAITTFKGSVVQYVGRMLRLSGGKKTIEVHDYVDSRILVLERMHQKRLPGFVSLGFDNLSSNGAGPDYASESTLPQDSFL